MAALVLDVKDRKILSELDLNAREFVSNVARKVGLSKEVVNYRIKRLQSVGVIQGFSAIVNPSKAGYQVYRLFLKYQNVSPEKEVELLEYLRQHPNIGWVTIYGGLYDLAILFWAKDIYSFREMCDDFLNRYGKYFQGAIKTTVMEIYHFKHNFL